MKITSLEDIRRLKEKYALLQMQGNKSMFRGHADESWELICSLNRYKEKFSEWALFEKAKAAYCEFRNFAQQQNWINYKPTVMHEDFFYMSIGRHLGLICNLLDWTSCLETAVEFAAQKETDKDGCLHVLYGRYEILNQPLTCSPFDFCKLPKNTFIKDFDFIPDNSSIAELPLGRLRRMRQNGFFTITIPDVLDSEENTFRDTDHETWVIPATAKPVLLEEIRRGRGEKDWYLLESKSEEEAVNVVQAINKKYFCEEL